MPGAIADWRRTYLGAFRNRGALKSYEVYGGTPGDGSDSCWAPSHVTIKGGTLILKGYQDPAAIAASHCVGDANQWVTGGVKLVTNSQRYGKYEVRMRVDNGQGISAVALLWPTTNTWPPEIDFAEDDGASPRSSLMATVHWGTSRSDFEESDYLAVDLSQWHTLGVVWSPGEIVYTIDGSPWAAEANTNVPDVPMQLALQTEAWQCGTSSWEVCANGTAPKEVDMDVDWIAVYAPSHGTAAIEHIASSPATNTGNASVSILAFLALSGIGAGLYLEPKRRRNEVE